MKNYIVHISFYEPYPKQYDITVEASNTARACWIAYKELKEARKGKREPQEVTFKVARI